MTAPSGGGMAPEISLDYNSQSGGGLAGPGWNLSGLSAISRCAQTREAGDPRPVGVDLTATDRFCLDGQRLIVSNGLAYGADGAEYRTEVDQILRVRSHGLVGGGPAWFKVWRKDGTIAWYGAGDDAGANHSSRVSSKVGAAPVFAWNLGRIADSAGNFMVFNWQDWHPGDLNVQTTLSSIQYGGHSSGFATNHQILLTYADRPAVERATGYSAGAKFKSTKRLTQIRSLAAGVELRRWIRPGLGSLRCRSADLRGRHRNQSGSALHPQRHRHRQHLCPHRHRKGRLLLHRGQDPSRRTWLSFREVASWDPQSGLPGWLMPSAMSMGHVHS